MIGWLKQLWNRFWRKAPAQDALLHDALTGRFSLVELAARRGVNRHEMRQLLQQGGVYDSYKAAVAAHRAMRERDAVYREFARRASMAEPCAVCGSWVLRLGRRAGRRTCSKECAEAWPVLRFVLDAEIHDKHRAILARGIMAKPESTNAQRNWATKVLNGVLPSEPKYVFSGSARDDLLKKLGKDMPREQEFFSEGLPWADQLRAATRKTECKNGHPFTAENTYVAPGGTSRTCRECLRRRTREGMKRLRERAKKAEQPLSV